MSVCFQTKSMQLMLQRKFTGTQMDAQFAVQERIGGNGIMATHHGGKTGKAAKTLASKNSSRKARKTAGKTLAIHKAKFH